MENQVSLLHLDDYLLANIIKYLNPKDVMNVAQTCRRLMSVAHDNLRKNKHIHWCNNGKQDFTQMKNTLVDVGSHIKIMELTNWSDAQLFSILMLIAEYCSELDTLSLNNINVTRSEFLVCDRIMSMLHKLKRFEIRTCDWIACSPLNIFFGANSALQHLIVRDFSGNGENCTFHLADLRTLKSLHLVNCRHFVNSAEIQHCLENNEIVDLSLIKVENACMLDNNFIAATVETVKNLAMDVSINPQNRDYLELLLNLRKLESLQLQCEFTLNVDRFLLKLGTRGNIEELHMRNVFFGSSTILDLSTFRQLKKLVVDNAITDGSFYFFRMFPKMLPRLEEFTYANSRIIDGDILYMFKLMPNLKYLSLHGSVLLQPETLQKMEEIARSDSRRKKFRFIAPNTY